MRLHARFPLLRMEILTRFVALARRQPTLFADLSGLNCLMSRLRATAARVYGGARDADLAGLLRAAPRLPFSQSWLPTSFTIN